MLKELLTDGKVNVVKPSDPKMAITSSSCGRKIPVKPRNNAEIAKQRCNLDLYGKLSSYRSSSSIGVCHN